MTQPIKLSGRLEKVAAYLPKKAFFADIGSDHAYLACYVCQHDDTARAIAGELNEGPFQSACRTVASSRLTGAVDVRLGDGLEVIQEDKVTEVVIAGMGGALIANILDRGAENLAYTKRIITQPNVDAEQVRRWFLANGFTLTQEEIMEEKGHIYEILIADKQGAETPYTPELRERQLLFGPFLMREKDAVFLKKWNSELGKLQCVLTQMEQANVQNTEKVARFEKQLFWMKEVLQNDDTAANQ